MTKFYRNRFTLGDIPQLDVGVLKLIDGLDSFTDWTNSGCSITANGNPSGNCFTIPLNQHAHRQNAVFQGANFTYEVDMLVNGSSILNFFFGCNSSGAGYMARIDTRPGGYWYQLLPTTSWTSWGSLVVQSDYNLGTSGVWVKVKVEYISGTIKVYFNDVLKLTYSAALTGNWIGFNGDGAGTGGRADNLKQIV